MWTSGLRNASDYNRGVAAPVRWAHLAAAAARPVVAPAWGWANAERRRAWAPRLLIGAVFVLLLLPLDGLIGRWTGHLRMGGDLRRELEALQQYGQGLSSLLVAAVIWLQDPPRRRKLANWAAAFAAAFLVVTFVKMFVGRPRPKYDDPWTFLGPFGQYPVDGAGVRHAWEVWGGISSDLWSMPSSHTAYAVVMAVFVGATYPRLRGLVWLVAALVGVGRILTHAHYPSDVAAGWAIGAAVATAAVMGRWGERWLDARSRREGSVGVADGGMPLGQAAATAAGAPTAAASTAPEAPAEASVSPVRAPGADAAAATPRP